ncbi:WXG100 family type VII secretion target [Micromonospora marina]|uniref:WXG100 family type VII secretion target n=1 Tax=Micromonospora marina TaxID=307120 RepID=UPI0034511639
MAEQIVSVTGTGMKSAAQAFHGALQTSQAELGRISQDVSGTLRAAWTGDAAVRFAASMQRWCDEYRKVNVELERILNALESNRKGFEKAQSDVSRIPLPGMNNPAPLPVPPATS